MKSATEFLLNNSVLLLSDVCLNDFGAKSYQAKPLLICRMKNMLLFEKLFLFFNMLSLEEFESYIVIPWMSLFLRKNHLLRCYGSLLNWIEGSFIMFITKIASKKIGALIH